MAFLEMRGVCKGYGGDPRQVLADIDLSIEQGELVCVVGRSGAGKTTLLSLVAGLIQPCRGEVRLRGRPVIAPGPDRAVVFQSYSLLPWLTVHDNVRLAVDRVHRGWSAAKRRDRADEYVALVGLTPARDKFPAALSGGMRQRVAVARALAMEPEVLLMDEPLAALDALTRGTLQDEIEKIWSRDRKTALMVSNDIDEAIRLADRIIPLGRGPGASLGDSIRVDFARPRDRKALVAQPAYHALRARLYARLRDDAAPGPEIVEDIEVAA